MEVMAEVGRLHMFHSPSMVRWDLQCQPVRQWTPERLYRWITRMASLQAEQNKTRDHSMALLE